MYIDTERNFLRESKEKFVLSRVTSQIDQLKISWHENQELEAALPVSTVDLLTKVNIYPMKMI